MKENTIYIEKLIERFFDGETSNREEKELYAFFAQEDIPEPLIQYKEVFEYFEKGLQDDIFTENLIPVIEEKNNFPKRVFLLALSTAACIALAIYFYPKSKKEYHIYEGSYIVRNGEKITDLEIILPELQVTAYCTEQTIKETQEKWNNLSMATYTYTNTEEKISTIYAEIANRFPEGTVREEVYKTLKD